MLPSVRKRVRNYLYLSSVISIAVLLLLFVAIQIIMARHQAVTDADIMFEQIEQMLEDNEKNLRRTTADFKNTTLQRADTIAYIIDHDENIVNRSDIDLSVIQLQNIARLTGVDEIHLFDDNGLLFLSTVPRYINNYTLDSGEQISFFRPMLDDPTERLCQDIMPNTADGKEMMYAAVWSNEYIVQVGITPDTINAVTAHSDSSHIFSILNVSEGVFAYAVNNSGVIAGSTVQDDVGKSADEVGLPFSRISAGRDYFTVTLHGQTRAFCVVNRLTSGTIVYLESNRTLYRNVPVYCLIMFLALVFANLLLIFVVHLYVRRHLIESIDRVNASLTTIAEGNLENSVNIADSQEFSDLSYHINQMVKSLLSNTDKVSYVLQKANLSVGVYEYNRLMKRVRLTAGMDRLFGVSEEKMQTLAGNTAEFRRFVEEMRSHVLPDAENIYIVTDDADVPRYIKIEESNWNGNVFGVVIDMTATVQHSKQLEQERDIDLLTGLYNRRGAEARVAALFATPEKMAHGAVVMLDADGLKIVNDRFGHDDGDRYLRGVAGVLEQISPRHRLAARVGGDEFVLLLYGYKTEEALLGALDLLRQAQENTTVTLHDGREIQLQFSYGYQKVESGADYATLLAAADTLMYENKRWRKVQSNAEQ